MGSLTRVHAPLREARRWDYLRGRPSAGARSLAGGAEHAFLGTPSGEHMFATVTINPLDKACQVSLARKIGWWGGAGARIYAELSGYNATTDGLHETRPDPEGTAAARAIAWRRREPCAPTDAAEVAGRGPRRGARTASTSTKPSGDRLRAGRSAALRVRASAARAVQLLWVWGAERGAGVLGGPAIDANGAAEAALSLPREAGGRPQGTPLRGGSAGGARLASGSLGHSLDIAPGAGAPPFAPPD